MKTNRPAQLTVMAMVFTLSLAMVVCGAVVWLEAGWVDLFHLVYFDSCAMRAHQWQWQNASRHPQVLRYDFSLSPISFVLVEIWVRDGQTLMFSQRLPFTCGNATTSQELRWPRRC
ncbi:MAG: hypothetical protein HYZ49_01855 [Chloroflexi bacterium]|nr:hypothetical protein [Chloroflexota bacterium]